MKSENDRRRGGHWSRERKEKFIQENFGTELGRDGRGGDYGNQHTGGKTSLKFSQPASLAREIEKKSRGRITKGTADRLLADMRKKTRKKPESGTKRLSAKEKRRAEKLAARLETLQNVISVLEKKLVSARAAEKSAIAELKKLR